MLGFGFSQRRVKLPPPYIAKIRIEVLGRLSSYTRGGELGFFKTDTSSALVYNTDFTLGAQQGITYSTANMNLFLGGSNPSSEIVATNKAGWLEIEFPPDALTELHHLTIQGRTTADSTHFKFIVIDNHGHILWQKGLQAVRAKETWDVGISL